MTLDKVIYERYTRNYLDENGNVQTDFHSDGRPGIEYAYPYIKSSDYFGWFSGYKPGDAVDRAQWIGDYYLSTYQVNLLKSAAYPGGLDDDSFLYIIDSFGNYSGELDAMFVNTNTVVTNGKTYVPNTGDHTLESNPLKIKADDIDEPSFLIVNQDFRYSSRNIAIEMHCGYTDGDEVKVPDKTVKDSYPYICFYVDYVDEDNYKMVGVKYYYSTEHGLRSERSRVGVNLIENIYATHYQFLNIECFFTEVVNGAVHLNETEHFIKAFGNYTEEVLGQPLTPVEYWYKDYGCYISGWCQYLGEDVLKIGFDFKLKHIRKDNEIQTYNYDKNQDRLQKQIIAYNAPVFDYHEAMDASYSWQSTPKGGCRVGFGTEEEGSISIYNFLIRKTYFMDSDESLFVMPENVSAYDKRFNIMSYHLDAKAWECNEVAERKGCYSSFMSEYFVFREIDATSYQTRQSFASQDRFNNPYEAMPRVVPGTDDETLELEITGVKMDNNWGWIFEPGREVLTSPHEFHTDGIDYGTHHQYTYYFKKGGSLSLPNNLNGLNSTFILKKVTARIQDHTTVQNYNFIDDLYPGENLPPPERLPCQSIYHLDIENEGICTDAVFHTIITKETRNAAGAITATEDFDFGTVSYNLTDLFIFVQEDGIYFAVGIEYDLTDCELPPGFSSFRWNYTYPQPALMEYYNGGVEEGFKWFGIPREDINGKQTVAGFFSTKTTLMFMSKLDVVTYSPNILFENESPYNYADIDVDESFVYSTKMNLRTGINQANTFAVPFERSLHQYQGYSYFQTILGATFGGLNWSGGWNVFDASTPNLYENIWNKSLAPYNWLEVADFTEASIKVKSITRGKSDINWDAFLQDKCERPDNAFTNPGNYPESLYNKVIN